MNDKLSPDILRELGFKEVRNFTITGAMTYQLGRRRHLSVGCVGTPNETLFICESDAIDPKNTTDLICLHNYDYDGYLTVHKLQTLIKSIGTGVKPYPKADVPNPF